MTRITLVYVYCVWTMCMYWTVECTKLEILHAGEPNKNRLFVDSVDQGFCCKWWVMSIWMSVSQVHVYFTRVMTRLTLVNKYSQCRWTHPAVKKWNLSRLQRIYFQALIYIDTVICSTDYVSCLGQGVKFLSFPIVSYFSQHTPIFPIF